MTMILPLAFWLALGLAAPAPQDVEIVKEFKQYFRQYKDAPTRVEAVMSLAGCESPMVVEALLPVLKLSAEPDVVRAAIKVLSGFRSRPPVEAMLAQLAETKDEALKVGLLESLAAGAYEGGDAAMIPLLSDRSWDVRRRCVDALSSAGGSEAATSIAPLVSDAEPAVRCATLEGLARLKSDLVLEPALAALQDPVWQVRSSAAKALQRVRHKRSILPLITRMEAEEGRLRVDYSEALREVTGRDFGTDVEGWKRFWATYGERFEIPTDQELAKLREKQRESKARYVPPGSTTFGGVDTPSRALLFIIDVSGSMEHEVAEKDRFKDGGYAGFSRMEIVRTELQRTIERLESYVQFNILAFASEVRPWKRTLVPANVLNKSSAVDFARRLEALGGSSKDELALAGLVGAANLGAGRTNTYAALMAGLEAAGQGAKDKSYAVAVDTIFFLSDGRPSVGDYTDPKDVLREVREANELRKVVIHTIAIGDFQKDFMEMLAEENGGVFVDLGN
jgi:hypothetical protein